MNTHDIYIDWEFPGANPYKPLLTRVIAAALEAEGVRIPCGVDVLLTDDEGIREINREQREVDSVTDVLSFPMLNLTPGTPPDGTGEEEHDPETGLCYLGDMVIDLNRAKAQAEEFGHSVQRELAYLAVHSVLHLLGYDHLDEGPQKAQMRAREEAILEALGVTRDQENPDLDAPLEPAAPYTDEDLNWTDENSRVVYEYTHPEARDVALMADTVDNWDEYDTVLVGYPIWLAYHKLIQCTQVA